MARKSKPAALIFFALVLVVAWVLENRKQADAPGTGAPPTDEPGRAPPPRGGEGAVDRAAREQRSGVWVEDEGRIVHLLPDDRIAPRHQLCLVELASGHTIKISHNVDLAPQVPWKKGDTLAFRGRFEWNDKGGVVHWTHRDPDGRSQGGWLRLGGRTYR